MQAILAVTIPFFALVLTGYLAARQHVLPESAIPGLNAYVLYFALPCMLFRFGAVTPLVELLNPVVLTVYIITATLIVGFTIAVTLGKKVHLKDAAFGALVAAFPNTGFMGLPMLVALLGPAAAGPMACLMLVDFFYTSAACIALSEWHDSAGQGTRVALISALRGALSNPMPWAIALGALASLLDVRPTGALETVLRMLADSATPVALFAIGAVLWRSGQRTRSRTRLSRVVPVALIKLIIHPILVFGLGLGAMRAGAPLTNYQLMVITLAAALPSASNVSLLAERHGADNGRVARIILTSTVLAFGSFSALAWLFGIAGYG
jgi:predicted permease